MKISIEPTGKFEKANGVLCRIWKGVTEQGVACEVFVAMVQVEVGVDNSAFEQELSKVKTERQAVVFDNRFVV